MVRFALVGCAIAASLSSVASANLLENGSFELGLNPGANSLVEMGDTDIAGWTIASGNVNYIGSLWEAGDGGRSIDLIGREIGSIAQTFDVVAGGTYQVQFDLSGNPAGGDAMKILEISALGQFADFGFDTTGMDFDNMGWETNTWEFTAGANDTEATLIFASTAPIEGGWGPALDNIIVTQIPAPGVLAVLLGGMAVNRRRRTAS